MAQVPEHARFELEPDQEEHHDDAELGEVLQVLGLVADEAQDRADDDARHQVAQHGSEPQPCRDRHRDHRGDEVDRRLIEESVHEIDPKRCV